MKSNNKKVITIVATLSIVFGLIGIWGTNIKTDVVEAQSSSNKLSGYAWSDNIGWISFENSTGGNVLVDSSGNLNGFAWSENIGWVKFGGLSSFPSSGNNAKLDGDNLTGWARACAGTVNGDCNSADRTDGWDGWISLSGPGYGVKLDGNSSYAWGSDVVGWIDFKLVTKGGLSASCVTNPNKIQFGINENVTRNIIVSGGSGAYTYSWSGTDISSDNSSSISTTYTTNGIKEARAIVTSGSESLTVYCQQIQVGISVPTSASTVSLSMNPPLADKNGYCTANYSLIPPNASTTCSVWRSGGSIPETDGSSLSGFQVSPGHEYKVRCTQADGAIIESPSRRCNLNPTVNEI